MKPSPSSEHDEKDRKIIKLFEDLRSLDSEYPADLLTARRAAFVAQIEQLNPVEMGEELSGADQEVVKRLGKLKSAQVEYPPELLAARRSAFLRQAAGAGGTSLLDRLRLSVKRIIPSGTTVPSVPWPGFKRLSLVIASLLAAVLIGSLLFNRAGPSVSPSPSQAAAAPTQLLPAGTGEVALTVCMPGDPALSCPPGELTPDQDLASQRNGLARPAVSRDARSGEGGVHRASYVNDGREGASWVSNSPDSWIKIDLGKVTTINTVSLQPGNINSSGDNNPGQFVIAVALSDVYSDGNSSDDYREYAQVFSSAQTGFSGSVSPTETIRTQFPPARARFVKITFEQAGAAIEQVGVFMVPPPAPVEQGTGTPRDALPVITLTAISTGTPGLIDLATSQPTGTAGLIPANTLPPAASSTPGLLSTNTPLPSTTSTPLPADTATPVPTDPLHSETPVPSPTMAPPTAIPPSVTPSPVSTVPIVVTGNGETLTFTCNGNAVAIRGHVNTVTLLGSCSSITVTGNGNRVFWQSGSPVISDLGTDNIISQR